MAIPLLLRRGLQADEGALAGADADDAAGRQLLVRPLHDARAHAELDRHLPHRRQPLPALEAALHHSEPDLVDDHPGARSVALRRDTFRQASNQGMHGDRGLQAWEGWTTGERRNADAWAVGAATDAVRLHYAPASTPASPRRLPRSGSLT